MKINKEINYRTCVLTRQKLHKSKLIRIVLFPDKKTVEIDWDQTLVGRGMYFQNSQNAVAQLKQKNLVAKIFKTSIDSDWYKNLESELKKHDTE